ncbi:MAG: PQQ-binding-like beta-propeller repeat protein [Pirellulales bacterium]|nr:PQQ-binding-like beta-propeller repeat protein [Pirellulales bacterium]
MSLFKSINALFAIALLPMLQPSSGWADDWPMFRGRAGRSVVQAADLPLEWSISEGKNVAWEADLPGRGVSSPIVVAGKVFVTASSGPNRGRLHVLAYDASTGEQLWHRQFWATGRTLCHSVSAVAAPTPASDGNRIFAYFSSNDVMALDLEGNLLWMRALALDYPGAGNDIGMSSSPVVAGDVVVVQSEALGNAFVAALDVRDGATRWDLERTKQSNWASPVALQTRYDGGALQAVLLQSPDGVSLHRADTGKKLWELEVSCEHISSIVFDKLLYVPSKGIQVWELFSSSESEEEGFVWSESKLQPGSPSPVVVDDRVFVINRAGVLTCGSLTDKKISWRKRLGGTFWATPVAVGNHLYCINAKGKSFVVEAGEEKGRIVSEDEFGEDVLGSPAVADSALFVRSHRHLWKIAK